MVKPQRPEEFTSFRRLATPGIPGLDPRIGLFDIKARLKRASRAQLLFLIMVALPTLLATFYFYVLAADIYVSEAKFFVRSQSSRQQMMTGLSSLLQGTGLSRSQDDTYAVHDFILSRDALNLLRQKNDMDGVMSRPEADFIARFPNFYADGSFESQYKAYKRFVNVIMDSTTGVSTIEVRAFRPEDARAIATALLSYSEDLVNRLNDRARRDAMDVARKEVEIAEARIQKVLTSLAAYRNRESMLDPVKSSAGVMAVMEKLNGQRAAVAIKLAELMAASPNSPQVEPLRNNIAALDVQIAEQRAKLTGQDSSIASRLSEYERLQLEKEFADKQLASATLSLESARNEAARQQLYLDRVVQPNLADYALFPRRFVSVVVVAFSCFLIYGIAWLLIASIREHAHG